MVRFIWILPKPRGFVMAHSQSIVQSETGWQWPWGAPSPEWLAHVVSALDQTRAYIEKVTAGVTEEDLWWRPDPDMNSMANLLLHLASTEHQWIGNKVGGNPLRRDRDHEFSARGGYTLAELKARLALEQHETAHILSGLEGKPENAAILYCFHYTENHFAYHCGELAILRRLKSPSFRLYG